MRQRKRGDSPSSERVAYQRRASDSKLLVKAVEKIHERSDAIIDQRLVRFAEADLIGDDDAVLLRQRTDRLGPVGNISAETVQQDHYRPAARVQIVNLHSVNSSPFIRRFGVLRGKGSRPVAS